MKDFCGVVGKENVIKHPGRGAFLGDHEGELFAQRGEVGAVHENVGHAGTDTELEVAHFDADLLQCADAAGVEDAKVGDLEPFLAEVAGRFLEGVEEIHAQLGRLGFELEETCARESALAAGLFGGEAHHTSAAAGEHADVGADEAGEAFDQTGDAGGVGGIEANGGAAPAPKPKKGRDEAYAELKAAILFNNGVIVEEGDRYIRSEFTDAVTGVVDDVEFLISLDLPICGYRSAARKGGDDKRQRNRIKEIRKSLQASGWKSVGRMLEGV